MLKKAKVLIIAICLIVISILPSFSISAAEIRQGVITVGTVTGNTGDTVIVPITIAENPGICGITVSITYNSSALEYVESIMGNVIYEYATKAHPSRNIIRLVTSEQGNKYNNGTMLGLKFKIADKAPAELHKIDITYSSGDFCNWKLDRIMPTIVSGGVNVNLSQSNCPHKSYSEWTVATIPSCLENGADQRTCNACGHVELRDTSPIGHEYSKDYTIDKEATKTESGLMSRHCTRCKDFIDQISYSLEQSEEGKIENTFDTTIPSNDYIEDLYKEQYPEKPTTSAPQTNESSKPQNDNTSNNSSLADNPDVSEQPLIEPDENVKISVLDKIKESFPNINLILSIFAVALVILFIIVLI